MSTASARRAASLDGFDEQVARRTVPDGPIRIPDDRLACCVCGVSSPRPTDPSAIVVREIFGQTPAGQPLRGEQVEMTRCADCAGRLDEARALVESHPALGRALGPARAIEAAEGVLSALALLGRPSLPPSVSDKALGLNVRHLSRRGLALAFALGATLPSTASPYAFASVSTSERQALRDAFGRMLRERIAATAPSIRITPPGSGGGCLLCGVGAVVMAAEVVERYGGRAEAQAAVWRALFAPRAALGGHASPDPIAGHVCQDCGDAIESAGAIGPTALERSFVEYLASTGRLDDARRVREAGGVLPGLAAWAVLDVAPNRERWDHVRLVG